MASHTKLDPAFLNYLHKDELIYELKIRDVILNDGTSVDCLRKYLRPLLRAESPNVRIECKPGTFDVAEELVCLEQKLASIQALVDEYLQTSGAKSVHFKIRIQHCVNRILRLTQIALEDTHDQRMKILTTLLDFLDTLETEDVASELARSFIQEHMVTKEDIKGENMLEDPILNSGVKLSPITTHQDDISPPTRIASTSIRHSSPVHRPSCPVMKWNLKFNGNHKDMTVYHFLERVEELRIARGFSLEQLYESAIDLFEGKALLWYRSNSHRFHDWTTLSELLVKHYEPPDYKSRLFQDILSRTQDPNETFIEYFSCILSMFRRYGPVTEDVQLEIISRNLSPFYTMQLPTVRTLSELEDECLKLEQRKFRADHYKPPQLKRTSYVEPDFAYVDANPKMEKKTTGSIGSADICVGTREIRLTNLFQLWEERT